MKEKDLKEFLDAKVDIYNQPSFIKNDPISIPHLFNKKQDMEIAGFFAAVFSWGNRATIINKSKELMQLMGNAPYDFCLHHSPKELKKLVSFKHRTFSTTDLLYFIEFFKCHYSKHKSLEIAFIPHPQPLSTSGEGSNIPIVEVALKYFHHNFFSLEHVPARTKKHIATPERKSSCKRLNMFLRWMVRNDNKGVDFGIWKNILPAQLICPIDVHVSRVAKRLGILKRKQTDWQAATELTEYLRTLDKNDPVKYDFALFGLGVMEKY
jgi:uncharacterized protein (TIGR02757 family)